MCFVKHFQSGWLIKNFHIYNKKKRIFLTLICIFGGFPHESQRIMMNKSYLDLHGHLYMQFLLFPLLRYNDFILRVLC